MPRISLTQISIDALKTEQQTDFWDKKLGSFGVRVGPRSKTFIAKVRNRRITIGAYPTTTLQDARRRALALKADGSHVGRSVPFTEAREKFLAHKEANLRPRSYREIKRTLTVHFNWTKALDRISHHDVATAIDAIKKPSEANHAFKDIRTFFNWCVPRYIKHSPCAGLKTPNKSSPRARVLSDAELKLIWDASEGFGDFGIIVRLLMFTGQRRGEIAALKGEYIDRKRKTVCLPNRLTKNKREHLFPIGQMSRSLIPRAETGMLFPARGKDDSHFNGWSKSKVALDKAISESSAENPKARKLEPWTLHDLRRTYRTIHGRIRTPPHIAERLVNHVSARTPIEIIYDHHTYLDEMREAVEAYEAFLLPILSPQ